MSGTLWLWLLPLLPLTGGVLLLLSGQRADKMAAPLAILLAALSVGLTVLAWYGQPATQIVWFNGWSLRLSAAAASAPLAVLVAVMALVIFVYARGYMAQDPNQGRFFGFMSLFLGGMELLVLSDSLLTLLLGWEAVGLCSYALIGFWYLETPRVVAAQRAFVTTRSADLGLYLAAMAAFSGLGGFAFADLPALTSPLRQVVIGGLLLAALGKSAQLPFSGWLSGAMQGPTPVSALIHAATMVAAGAILLIKAEPLLKTTAWSHPLILWVGVATALTAAVIALYQSQLKQVIAASTVSQYGYIFAVLGVGGTAAGSTQLLNHAAYKGLLFMGAGVMVHQGLKFFREMGGLGRAVPVTSTVFAIGAWSLAALPPMGGFFSKESLIHVVAGTSKAASWLLLGTGFLTAAYAARAWFAAFAGQPRGDEARRLQSPGLWMEGPMMVLSLAVVTLGVLALYPMAVWWGDAIGAKPVPPFSWLKAVIPSLLGIAALVWIGYRQRRDWLVPMAPLLGGRFAAAARDWLGLVILLDSIGHSVVALGRFLDRVDRAHPAEVLTTGVRALARYEAWFDVRIISQGVVDRLAHWIRRLAAATRFGDVTLIEGILGRLIRSLQASAAILSRVQTGLLYQYYLWMVLGAGTLLIYILIIIGWGG